MNNQVLCQLVSFLIWLGFTVYGFVLVFRKNASYTPEQVIQEQIKGLAYLSLAIILGTVLSAGCFGAQLMNWLY